MKIFFRFVAVALFVGLGIIPVDFGGRDDSNTTGELFAMPLTMPGEGHGIASSVWFSNNHLTWGSFVVAECCVNFLPVPYGCLWIQQQKFDQYSEKIIVQSEFGPLLSMVVAHNIEYLSGIRWDSPLATPTVTAKLILVDIDNPASLTSTLMQTVPVSTEGNAFPVFRNVPALTAIGDIHIYQGSIDSLRDFQGAIDLGVGSQNVVSLSPTGSKTQSALKAEVIRSLAASPRYRSLIAPNLAARVEWAILESEQGLASEDPRIWRFVPFCNHLYDDAIDSFWAHFSTIQKIITASPTVLFDQAIGASATNIVVMSPNSALQGFEMNIPAGAFTSDTRLQIAEAPILSHWLPAGVAPITPLIRIDMGGEWARLGNSMLVKIPVKVPASQTPLVCQFFPETGEFRSLEIIERASDAVTISRRNFDSLRGLYYNAYGDLSKLKGITPQGIIVFAVNKSWAAESRWLSNAEDVSIIQALSASESITIEKGPPTPGIAKTVRFQVHAPSPPRGPWTRYDEPPLSVTADSASATPTATVKLILVNVGNVASPTTIISKVISIASGGRAIATFTDIPALTAIGEMHIDNGHIGSWTDFQGVIDLIPGREEDEPSFGKKNIVYLNPKGCKTSVDLDAEIIRRLVASQSFQSQIIPQLAARVDFVMRNLVMGRALDAEGFWQLVHSNDSSCENAMSTLLAFEKTLPRIKTASPTVIFDQHVGARKTNVKISNSKNILNGMEITITAGNFLKSTRFRITAADIVFLNKSEQNIRTLLPVPFISIDYKEIDNRLKYCIRIPAEVPNGQIAEVSGYMPTIGRTWRASLNNTIDNFSSLPRRYYGEYGLLSAIFPRGFILVAFVPLPSQ